MDDHRFWTGYNFFLTVLKKKKGGGVAQSVEGATPGQKVVRSIPAPGACSLLVGSVSV